MRWVSNITVGLWVGFALSFAVTVTVIAVAAQNLTRYRATTEWVRQSYDDIDEIQAFGTDLKAALAAQRGLRLTGVPAYLTSFNRRIVSANMRLAKLAAPSVDNVPGYRDQLRNLKQLFAQLTGILRHEIAASPSPALGPEHRLMPGERLHAKIMVILARMQDEQAHLLGMRSQSEFHLARRVRVILLAGMVIALVGFSACGLAALSILRTLERRTQEVDKARAELETLNQSLERHVAERTAELEAVVSELDAFTYSVSHDLRAPLRGMDGFTRIVLDDPQSQLSAEAKGYLGEVRNNARRMARLVDDLLTFCRHSHQDLNKVPVVMTAMAREAMEHVQREQNFPHADIRIADNLPPARGDPILLREVMVNLLSNALKFSRDRATPVVEVGCRSLEGQPPVYFVRDNGVGFDMKHVGHLFGVFHRLHSDQEFEGTGVGLAIVRRIIQRHGGKVWAESSPGEGATFYFTIEGEEADVERRSGNSVG